MHKSGVMGDAVPSLYLGLHLYLYLVYLATHYTLHTARSAYARTFANALLAGMLVHALSSTQLGSNWDIKKLK
jgi:hypothetical protein